MMRSRWCLAGAVVLAAGVSVLQGSAQRVGSAGAAAPPTAAPPTAAKPSAPPAPATPPTPGSPQPPPVFRTGINVVRVDIIVTDRNGRPVDDLKPGDFDVSEDGKPQVVDTFKLVKLDGGTAAALSDDPPRPIRNDSDEEAEAARDDVRLFGIFLDDYHVRSGTSLSVREPLTKFIQTQLGPSDMVGLMYPLQPVATLRMTRDHDVVVRAIGQFTGRKFDYTPKNDIEQQYATYPAETVEVIRNQVSLSALKGLITHMGTLKEGRKALIVVSEGFSNTLPPQLRDPVAIAPGMGNPDRGNPMAGLGDIQETTNTFFASTTLDTYLREVYDTANRNNVALYPVDPRGLPTSEFDLSQPGIASQIDSQYLNATMNTLRVLAEQTDGRAIVNRNDLAVGMRQIIRDSSAYYLIGYNSSQAPSDGKFHEIKVRVKRPGLQVRARKGYWALTTDDVARALAPPKKDPPKAVEHALATISQPSASHTSVVTWMGASRGVNGKTKVTFVWEPTPKTPGDRATDAPARVLLTAIAADGSPVFRGRVPATDAAGAPPAGAAAAVRAPSRIAFDASPGPLRLRLSVEGAASQVIDTDSRDFQVPDLTAAQTVLGTPEVFRGRTARDVQQIRDNPDAVPVATRTFSRADRLLIRIPAYGPAGTTPVLQARLLNRGGQPMSDLAAPPPTSAGGAQIIEVPLAGLAAGEYLVEIKEASGDAAELVGFRVTT